MSKLHPDGKWENGSSACLYPCSTGKGLDPEASREKHVEEEYGESGKF